MLPMFAFLTELTQNSYGSGAGQPTEPTERPNPYEKQGLSNVEEPDDRRSYSRPVDDEPDHRADNEQEDCGLQDAEVSEPKENPDQKTAEMADCDRVSSEGQADDMEHPLQRDKNEKDDRSQEAETAIGDPPIDPSDLYRPWSGNEIRSRLLPHPVKPDYVPRQEDGPEKDCCLYFPLRHPRDGFQRAVNHARADRVS